MGRFILSEVDDWTLVHDDQNIRGWPVHDATGNAVGTVAELIANTDSELVETVVLDNGREYPARDIDIGDGFVRLKGTGTTGTDADPVIRKYENTRVRRVGEDNAATAHHDGLDDVFRKHYDSSYASSGSPYTNYAPAYHWGYSYGRGTDYRDRSYNDLEPEMRRRYEEKNGTGTWEKVKDAVRHAFDHGRRT